MVARSDRPRVVGSVACGVRTALSYEFRDESTFHAVVRTARAAHILYSAFSCPNQPPPNS